MNITLQATLKGIIILSLLFCAKISTSQNFKTTLTDAYYFTPQNLGTVSPQAAEFSRYGNLSMDYYNGLFSMEVPLFTYKDRDFELPISIKYVSNPFIPSKRPSIVGYNWMLNAGGVITREVYGSPDDVKERPYERYTNTSRENPYYWPDGILAAKQKGTHKNYTEAQYIGFNLDKGAFAFENRQDFKYDFQPDIFRFSFGEHSGSFIIGNDATPVLLEGQGYKIDISGLTVQENLFDGTPANSTIKITDPHGYVYEFGGNSSCFEYFHPNNPLFIGKAKPRYITSWFLKSIQAPNGRQITFTYESVKLENRYHYFVSNDAGGEIITRYTYPRDTHYPEEFPVEERETIWGSDFPNIFTKRIDLKDLVFSPLIKTIKIDNVTEIAFKSTDRFSSFYGDSPTDDAVKCLDSISCKYNSNVVHNIIFEYINEGKYSFLQKVRKTNQTGISSPQDNTYEFAYYLNRLFPSPKTISLDHWGGWSGRYTTDADAQNYCDNIYTNRAVNTTVCDFGLLQKVTYPTKGYSEIEYEYNRYNWWREKDMNKLSLNDHYSASAEPCFGARIKTIKDFDPIQNQYTNIRTFEYKNPLTNEGSGVISFKPLYHSDEMITTQYDEIFIYTDTTDQVQEVTVKSIQKCTFSMKSSNNYGTECNMAEYPIGYTDVIEKFQDGSYIHHQYSSWANTPDDMDFIPYLDGILASWSYSSSRYVMAVNPPSHLKLFPGSRAWETRESNYRQQLEKFGLYIPNDMSKFRGKLLNKTMYSSTGNLVYKESNTYNIDQAKSQYQFSISSISVGCAANKIYTVPCQLIRQNITDKNNVSEQIDYVYNTFGLVSSEAITRSDGKKQTTGFLYPFEINEGADATIMQKMTAKNILSNYIEKTTSLGNNNMIDGEYKKYNEVHPGLFLPERIDLLEKVTNPAFKPEIYYKYNDKGNIIEVTPAGSQFPISYLWGYKYQYPVAEIKNATYSDVCKAIGNNNEQTGKSELETIADKIEPAATDLNTINNLRSLLPDAMITTYTHKPLVGMKTVTDPSNKTTTYEYDLFNKLQSIRDLNGKIVEQYEYNYADFDFLGPVIKGVNVAFGLLEYGKTYSATVNTDVPVDEWQNQLGYNVVFWWNSPDMNASRCSFELDQTMDVLISSCGSTPDNETQMSLYKIERYPDRYGFRYLKHVEVMMSSQQDEVKDAGWGVCTDFSNSAAYKAEIAITLEPGIYYVDVNGSYTNGMMCTTITTRGK